MDYGQHDTASLYKEDPRRYLVSTKRFVGDEGGQVQELRTVRVEWTRNEQGRMVPVEVPGSEETLQAQLVLLALGFTGLKKLYWASLGWNAMSGERQSRVRSTSNQCRRCVHSR